MYLFNGVVVAHQTRHIHFIGQWTKFREEYSKIALLLGFLGKDPNAGDQEAGIPNKKSCIFPRSASEKPWMRKIQDSTKNQNQNQSSSAEIPHRQPSGIGAPLATRQTDERDHRCTCTCAEIVRTEETWVHLTTSLDTGVGVPRITMETGWGAPRT